MTPTAPDNLDLAIAECANAATTPERIAEVLWLVQSAQRQAKEAREALEWAMLAHIEATGRDLVIGDVRYYAGIAKTTKCLCVPEALRALFDAAQGDMDTVAACLSANAMKPGACKSLLSPNAYTHLFLTSEKPELREGKPQKRLLSANTRFAGGECPNDND